MSLLDDRINILDRNAGEADPFKQIFDIVNAILALVRVNLLTSSLCPPVNP